MIRTQRQHRLACGTDRRQRSWKLEIENGDEKKKKKTLTHILQYALLWFLR